jgi:hypothetical protein
LLTQEVGNQQHLLTGFNVSRGKRAPIAAPALQLGEES